MLLSALALAGNIAVAAAANIRRRQVHMPSHVSWIDSATVDDAIHLQLVLKMKEQDIVGHLKKYADPDSGCYGSWMTRDEVLDTFGPDQASVDAVVDWLNEQDIQEVSVQGWDVDFLTSIEQADRLFDADFAWYEVRGMRKLRTLKYSIPAELEHHVDLLTPTTYFGPASGPEPYMAKVLSRRDAAAAAAQTLVNSTSCERNIAPPCLDQLHDFAWYVPPADTPSRIGFASFLNQSAQRASYEDFLDTFSIKAKGFDSVSVNGGVSNQSLEADSGEADLDVQMMSQVAPQLRITEYIVGGVPPFNQNLDQPLPENNANEPYLEWYQYLMTQQNEEIPQVLSNSYGEPEDTVPYEYAKRVCDLIGLMGLRGVTILVSSGDTGVGSGCLSSDNKTAQFDAQFPASCPYITSVGGTQGFKPETAWSSGGGGFSKYFKRAWYQDKAVGEYLGENISNATRSYYEQYTDFSGRGFPDVAAHSFSPAFLVYSKVLARSGGTSASCPIVASLFALVNAMRLAAGQPTLGFANPWLYKLNGQGLVDIETGSATGCNGFNSQMGKFVPNAKVIPYASWNGTRGWDPVTGLGVPNLRKLADVHALGTCQKCEDDGYA